MLSKVVHSLIKQRNQNCARWVQSRLAPNVAIGAELKQNDLVIELRNKKKKPNVAWSSGKLYKELQNTPAVECVPLLVEISRVYDHAIETDVLLTGFAENIIGSTFGTSCFIIKGEKLVTRLDASVPIEREDPKAFAVKKVSSATLKLSLLPTDNLKKVLLKRIRRIAL